MPSGVYKHKLSNINDETGRADCAHCGPDILLKKRSNRWRCNESVKEGRRKEKNYHKPDYWRTLDLKLPGHGLRQSEAAAAKEGAQCVCGETDQTSLCIDHDHLTGAVRGVLCRRCNSALGLAKDRSDVLRALADYLDNPPGIQ